MGSITKVLKFFQYQNHWAFFFNNPWKWSQLKKEWNSTFSQIQLLNNLNESYLSLLKTTPTLCSLMWTEKKKNSAPMCRIWAHADGLFCTIAGCYCFGRIVCTTGSAKGFHGCTAGKLGSGVLLVGRSLSYITVKSIIRFSWDFISPRFK